MRGVAAILSVLIFAGCQTVSKYNSPGAKNGGSADDVHIAGTLVEKNWSAKYGIAEIPLFAPQTLYLKFTDGADGKRFDCDETGKQIESENLPNPLRSNPTGRVRLNLPATLGNFTKAGIQDAEADYVVTVSDYKSTNPNFKVQITALSDVSVTGTIQMTDAAGTNLNGSFEVRICRHH